MATNIYDFSAHLSGAVRANQFRVYIDFPSSLVARGMIPHSSTAREAATFLTNQGQLPQYTTEDTPIYYRGRVFHEAGEPTFQPWTCTIYNSTDFVVREAIEKWANAINAPSYVYGTTIPETYKGDVLVEQLDREGNTLRVYKLVGAWPSDTGAVELSFQTNNEAETFQVTFTYDFFIVGGSELLTSAVSD